MRVKFPVKFPMKFMVVLTMIALALLVGAGIPATPRPRLLGVTKISIRTVDLKSATDFYRGLLGFEEAYRRGDSRLFKINDRQFVEVAPGLNPADDRLIGVAIETDHAEQMRKYLGEIGWKVPTAVTTDTLGSLVLRVTDPEGRELEFIEYPASGRIRRDAGRALGAKRLSQRMMHAGVIVTNVPPALAFYAEKMGLREFWRGSARDSKYLSWINMRLPEGDDYLELMLYPELPPGDRRGSAHHLCLEVPDIELARAAIEGSPARTSYTRPIEIRVGVNRRRQLNLFDPDGTRSELMEPRTVDGVPPVSSTNPYPAHP